MKKLIPADTVDAEGNVWETVGENIRKGAKEFSVNDVKTIVDILFPINSVYVGENSMVLNVGEWKLLTTTPLLLVGTSTAITGSQPNVTLLPNEPIAGKAIAVRIWKRVS